MPSDIQFLTNGRVILRHKTRTTPPKVPTAPPRIPKIPPTLPP